MELTSLPDEILLLIIKQCSDKRGVLYNLAICSRRFHRITVPVLYSHVVLRYAHGRPLKTFFDAVLQSPQLAKFIRHICLPEWTISIPPPQEECEEDESRIDESSDQDFNIRECLITVVKDLPVPDGFMQSWCEDIEAYDSIAIEASFLARLPNLVKMEINWPGCRRFISAFITHLARGRNRVFRNLAQVLVNLAESRARFSDILPWLETPSITHLVMEKWTALWTTWRWSEEDDYHGAAGTHWERYGNTANPPISSVVHLELRKCIIDSQSLRTILRSCESLEVLVLDRTFESYDGYIEQLPARTLAEILTLRRLTLKGLRLSYFSGRGQEFAQEVSPIDFSTLSVLKELHVADKYLVKSPYYEEAFEEALADGDPFPDDSTIRKPLHERLPRSLRVLRLMIDEYDSNVDHRSAAIESLRLLCQNHGCLPRLRLVRVDADFKAKSRIVVETSGLREAARQAGIELLLMDTSVPPWQFDCKRGISEPGQWGYQAWDPDALPFVEK